MKTNLTFRAFTIAAGNLAAALALSALFVTSAAAQTNTFPSTGNAGVGTTTPTEPLEINKSQNAGTTLAVDNGYSSISNGAYSGLWFRQGGANRFFLGSNNDGNTTQIGGAGAVQLWNYINAPILFATNNSERMRIANSGNVGIGTSNPSVRLHLQQDVNGDNSIYVLNNGGGTSSRSLILFGETNSDAKYAYFGHFGANYSGSGPAQPRSTLFVGADAGGFNLVSYGGASSTGGKISFWTSPDAAGGGNAAVAERMRITSNGLFGIGTTNPSVRLGQKLDIAASASHSGVVLSTWSSSNAGSLLDLNRSRSNTIGTQIAVGNNDLLGVISGRGTDGTNFLTAAQVQFWVDGGVSNNVVPGRIAFNVTNSSGVAADAMTILNNGNVGIGTISPVNKLTVSSASGVTDSLPTLGAAGGKFALLNNGGLYGLLQGVLINGNAFLQAQRVDGAATAYHLLLQPNGGNVGIATTNPGYKLDVQGGQINSSGGLCIAGDCKTAWSQIGSQWSTSGSNISYSSGNVGVGTSTPGARLDVGVGMTARGSYSDLLIGAGGNNAQMEFYGPTTSSAITHDETLGGLVLYTNGPAWSSSMFVGNGGNVGIGTTSPASGYKLDVNGNTNVTGNLNVTGNINAKYQDLAEWVPSSEQLSAGTVVVLDTAKSNQVISSTASYDTRVAGVISEQPGITLGEGGEGKVLVATTGRVRVKVDASRGPIQIGDLLVTSDITGVAMKSEAVNLGGVQIHRPGTIIGKALEPLAKGSGEILVLLSLQ